MSDLIHDMTGRAQELLQALVPEAEVTAGAAADARATLREFVVAPEEVLFLPVAPVSEGPVAIHSHLHDRLKNEIEITLRSIDDPVIRELAEGILQEMRQLFDRLSLVESNLRKLDTLQENLSILEMMQFDIHSLVQFIQFTAMP